MAKTLPVLLVAALALLCLHQCEGVEPRALASDRPYPLVPASSPRSWVRMVPTTGSQQVQLLLNDQTNEHDAVYRILLNYANLGFLFNWCFPDVRNGGLVMSYRLFSGGSYSQTAWYPVLYHHYYNMDFTDGVMRNIATGPCSYECAVSLQVTSRHVWSGYTMSALFAMSDSKRPVFNVTMQPNIVQTIIPDFWRTNVPENEGVRWWVINGGLVGQKLGDVLPASQIERAIVVQSSNLPPSRFDPPLSLFEYEYNSVRTSYPTDVTGCPPGQSCSDLVLSSTLSDPNVELFVYRALDTQNSVFWPFQFVWRRFSAAAPFTVKLPLPIAVDRDCVRLSVGLFFSYVADPFNNLLSKPVQACPRLVYEFDFANSGLPHFSKSYSDPNPVDGCIRMTVPHYPQTTLFQEDVQSQRFVVLDNNDRVIAFSAMVYGGVQSLLCWESATFKMAFVRDTTLISGQYLPDDITPVTFPLPSKTGQTNTTIQAHLSSSGTISFREHAPCECGVHGSCQETGDCSCTDGYTGEHCETPPDSCAGVDCGSHGTCADGVCKCTDGYSGAHCETPPDPCAGVDCGDHGSCEDGVCKCTDGYSGAHCETPPDPCAGVDCGDHGSCEDGVCKCTDGYSGAHCETPPDPCAGIDCGSHGTCDSSQGGVCVCTDGYSGARCQNAPDPCAGVDCGAHGSCFNSSGQALCECTDGYSGPRCQTAPSSLCDGVNCGEHGYCDNKTGLCDCFDGWTGDQCQNQNPDDPCLDIDCGSHGYCQAGACVCVDGWSGDRCQRDQCFGVVCNEHQHCDDTHGECVCNVGYYGDDCSQVMPLCVNDTDCPQNAVCTLGRCECVEETLEPPLCTPYELPVGDDTPNPWTPYAGVGIASTTAASAMVFYALAPAHAHLTILVIQYFQTAALTLHVAELPPAYRSFVGGLSVLNLQFGDVHDQFVSDDKDDGGSVKSPAASGAEDAQVRLLDDPFPRPSHPQMRRVTHHFPWTSLYVICIAVGLAMLAMLLKAMDQFKEREWFPRFLRLIFYKHSTLIGYVPYMLVTRFLVLIFYGWTFSVYEQFAFFSSQVGWTILASFVFIGYTLFGVHGLQLGALLHGNRYKNLRQEQAKKKKFIFGALLEGPFDHQERFWSVYHIVRQHILCAAIACLQNHPVTSAAVVLSISSLYMFSLCYHRPFQSSFSNVFSSLLEVCTCLSLSCLLVFTKFHHQGWTIAALVFHFIVYGVSLAMAVSFIAPILNRKLSSAASSEDKEGDKLVQESPSSSSSVSSDMPIASDVSPPPAHGASIQARAPLEYGATNEVPRECQTDATV